MKEVFEEIMHKHTKFIGTNLEICDFDKAAEEINILYQKKLINARIYEVKNDQKRIDELLDMRSKLQQKNNPT